MAETQDVRENWSVTEYGVATPDEVEKALGWIAMEDAALSYRVGACFMRAGAFAAPVDTDGDLAQCARRLGWMMSEHVDGLPWERRGQVVAALQALGAALWKQDHIDASDPQVFLDCDGVLADFDSYAHAYFGMNPREYEKKVGSAQFWRELEAKGDFYRNLPLMPDAMALYEGVKHLKPTILTGCPRGDWAQGQKVAWAAEHFPGVPIITCRSADKRDHALPGDVLIDDWAQHRHRWIEMGGVFITHHCAETSLAALFAHYPKLAQRGEA